MNVYKFLPDSDSFRSVSLSLSNIHIRRLFSKGVFIDCESLDINIEISDIGMDAEFLSLYGWIPVISLDGWNELKAELMQEVQPIFVTCKSKDYVLLNVMEVVDALDRERSIVVENKTLNKVTSVERYVFEHDIIKNKYIFKISETAGLEVYVTDRFKSLIETKK
ncbi:imm11 family protein [Photobacterium aphoticum]|uniref:Immunity MXAN-0049 protein domain-containing protein n=1 Tax=Photobacterium aphoticum TaxID=754436 RepID=A0A0J1GRH6_9GAMM|nr:DUF1629 domain-containing protein [Photobacterium aphoticum]KLV02266.1 hypothetical protein ABT58_03680 [Photobacterium aphoticum]PSU57753.1 hypothetical protein C9I90_08840 [Photobacterium aphoticum]GHA55065.1 hypothetical protein GCM10007086_31380 [Photobacterium aphoticum]